MATLDSTEPSGIRTDSADTRTLDTSVHCTESDTPYNGNGTEYSFPWLQFQFEPPPDCLFLLRRQFLSFSDSEPNFRTENNFLKGCKWSPDGACFVSCVEDGSLRVFDLPPLDLGSKPAIDLSLSSPKEEMEAALIVWEGETIYDFSWYPFMTASDASTCVFAASSRAHPVHLWDAMTGQLRCTYRAYDSMDEITAANSVAFNSFGTKLFCGYKKKIRIFDVSRPGKECTEHSTLTSKRDGITGILSSFSFNPDRSGMFAVGSYGRDTALVDDVSMDIMCVLEGQKGGVTQVQFSKDGNYLYTGGRKDPEILCWDIRQTSGVLYRMERDTKGTNQRIAFDIEPCGRHLATGGEDGYVRIFDLTTGQLSHFFRAASDTVNGFSFHPSLPLSASSSGQRRFPLPLDSDEENDKKSQKEDREKGGGRENSRAMENCVAVWRFSTAQNFDHETEKNENFLFVQNNFSGDEISEKNEKSDRKNLGDFEKNVETEFEKGDEKTEENKNNENSENDKNNEEMEKMESNGNELKYEKIENGENYEINKVNENEINKNSEMEIDVEGSQNFQSPVFFSDDLFSRTKVKK